jgi:hypothetical protein
MKPSIDGPITIPASKYPSTEPNPSFFAIGMKMTAAARYTIAIKK